MKLVCPQTELSAKLSLLNRVVPSNPSHPVLANILFTAETDRLGLAAFDLSLGVQVWIPAEVETPGIVTLPARLLNDIVTRLPNAPVEISMDGLAATITCGQGHYQMQGIAAEEFPELPAIASDTSLKLPAGVLLEGLQGSLFAASSDEAKQLLTGLHVRVHEDFLELAATDGHRLAVVTASQGIDESEIDITIPAKALRELERMLGRQEGVLALRYDPSQIVFEFESEQGTARLSSRLLEGQYPAYNQLIPKQFERQMTVERSLFVGALDRIAVLAAQKNNIVKLKLDSANQQVGLSAEAPQFGSGEEFLPAQISGEDLDIAFNVRYLIEGLKAMGSREIQFQMNSETTPVVVSPLSGQTLSYLVMPIQIKS